MTQETVIGLTRDALMTALWTSLPLLAAGFVVGVAVGVAQVVTSLQDSGFAAVPRLAAFLCAILLVLPWMAAKMIAYTVGLWSDLSRYAN